MIEIYLRNYHLVIQHLLKIVLGCSKRGDSTFHLQLSAKKV